MEQDDEKKKLNEDVVVFMRKRSETEAPRYTARLKTYVDIQQKHRRAAAARRHSDHGYKNHANRKKGDNEAKQPATENTEHQGNEEDRTSRKGRPGEKCAHRMRSFSRSDSGEPSERCCRRRRRRRSRCRRRRRSCRRRRRSCRRRRRRCSRRRRRRSCRRRRRRRRRCR